MIYPDLISPCGELPISFRGFADKDRAVEMIRAKDRCIETAGVTARVPRVDIGMRWRILLLAAAATGCATQQQAPVTPPPPVAESVAPPVAAPLPSKPAPRPACKARVPRDVNRYADLDAASAADVFQQVAALQRGIAQRDAREKKLEAALRSCGGITK